MNSKYKVVAIAYKNIEKTVVERISKYSIKDIDDISDLETSVTYCGKGFNLNDRICIYIDWFKDTAIEKLKEGYIVSILELPQAISGSRVELLELLDIEYKEDLIILEKIDV